MKPFQVSEADDDIRLDRWIKRHASQISQGKLQQALRKGMVKLDGKKTEASAHVLAGQTVTIAPVLLQAAVPEKNARPTLSESQIKETRAMVLWQNPQCIVLNKPAGLATQGGSGVKDSVDGRLDALTGRGGERPRLVHRLDKDTSGVLLLARTAKDATRLTKAFASKEMEKRYWALVVGVPQMMEGKIDLSLAKLRISGEEKMGADEESGKRAITLYRVVERLGLALAWVELIPVTGRTHQLRAHMALIGHPIYGDGKYGGEAAFVSPVELSPQLHLHARRLALPGEGIDVTAPLPPHMRKSFKALGFSTESA